MKQASNFKIIVLVLLVVLLVLQVTGTAPSFSKGMITGISKDKIMGPGGPSDTDNICGTDPDDGCEGCIHIEKVE